MSKVTYEADKRNSNVRMSYDPKTGTWVKSTVTDSTKSTTPPSTSTKNTPKSSGSTSGSSSVTVKSSGGSNRTATEVKSKTVKKVQEQLNNTLTGDVSVTPTPRSFSVKVNDTITLKGLGKYLTGDYFVSKITRAFSADSGYSQTFSVLKTGFGDVKPSFVYTTAPKKASASSSSKKERPKEVKKSASPTYKVGDKVRIYTKDAKYSNAHEGVPVPAWVKELTLTIMQISSDGGRVLLKEIFSWTYISNIKRVS